MSTDPSLWPAVLAQLQSKLRKHQFDTWIRLVRPLRLSEGVLELEVPSQLLRDWLASHYADLILDAVAAITGTRPDLSFIVNPSLAQEQGPQEGMPSPAPYVPPRMDQADEDNEIRLNDDYTFDNFVVGPCNRLAHASAVAVAQAPGYAYNPLFMHGSVGLGKTHLIQAIAQALLGSSPRPKLLYMTCENFMNQFIRAVQKGDLERFRYRYRHLDALLIDDIHFLAKGERTQGEFFHTFNTLYNGHKQIVITSDSPPKEIPKIEERLISRFKWGMVVKLEVPSFETRVAIIRKKAQRRNCELPDDVIAYIAENIDTNIREIEGAIMKVIGVASLSDRPPDLVMAQAALAESIRHSHKTIRIEDIQNAVIGHFRVKLSDLQSKKRNKSVALPRHVCMYLARQLTSYSLEEIGGYFGGRDHSTVLHACDNIERRVESDPGHASTVQMLMEKLRSAR